MLKMLIRRATPLQQDGSASSTTDVHDAGQIDDNVRQSTDQPHPAGSTASPSPTSHISASHGLAAVVGVLSTLLLAGFIVVTYRFVRRRARRTRQADEKDGSKEARKSAALECQDIRDIPLASLGTPTTTNPTCSTSRTCTPAVDSPGIQVVPKAILVTPPRRPELHISTASPLPWISSPRNSAFLSSPQSSTLVEDNAGRISRAMASSPVVSALLHESFDQSTSQLNSDDRGTKSFDWDRCTFAEEEERAMWLPDEGHFDVCVQSGNGVKRKRSCHTRSLSEPISIPYTTAEHTQTTCAAEKRASASSSDDRPPLWSKDVKRSTRKPKS